MKKYILLLFMGFSVAAFPQEAMLSGHISLPDSIQAAGATIVVKGTTLGAVSDNNGFYLIKRISTGPCILRISLLGYETREESVVIHEGRNNSDMLLSESNINLNEVVITGTRTEKTLKEVPVLTQVINGRQMLNLGIATVAGALQTMVPGIDVSQFGTRVSITMQGMDSKYVLFLVDG
jgi:outer membrane receptor for ferrienterochelin and colicins